MARTVQVDFQQEVLLEVLVVVVLETQVVPQDQEHQGKEIMVVQVHLAPHFIKAAEVEAQGKQARLEFQAQVEMVVMDSTRQFLVQIPHMLEVVEVERMQMLQQQQVQEELEEVVPELLIMLTLIRLQQMEFLELHLLEVVEAEMQFILLPQIKENILVVPEVQALSSSKSHQVVFQEQAIKSTN
jgi:hypothetical protein